MNKDKAIQLLERLQDPEPYEPMLTKDAYDAIQMAIDALSADGDTISRKAAIEICDHAIDLLKGQFGAGALVAIKESIEELPPAQPEIINCDRCVATKRGECIWHNAGAAYCSLGEVTE